MSSGSLESYVFVSVTVIGCDCNFTDFARYISIDMCVQMSDTHSFTPDDLAVAA